VIAINREEEPMSEKIGPAWGYHPSHGGRMFADGKLAGGFRDRPYPGQHPHDVEAGIAPPGAGEDGAAAAPRRRAAGRARRKP
jgi:hypothetical protein